MSPQGEDDNGGGDNGGGNNGGGDNGGGDNGGGDLPVTGISLTVLVLGGAALLHWGIVARLIAARKVRRPMA